MDIQSFISQFEANVVAIEHIVSNISAEQAHWKPDPTSWSIVEVINHLADVEREDFRERLEALLRDPNEVWPNIDPPSWVDERQYNMRELQPSLADFLTERQTSLTWLKSIAQPNWEAIYQHPQIGPIVARDLLGAWLAHDFLHLRQLAEINWAYLSQSFLVDYAGDW